MLNINLHINNYAIRTETHEGRRHIVVPAVIMREGVHCGNHGPLLHLAEELGRYTSAWDGIPVTIKHPEKDGVNVSANSPDISESYKVGVIFNTVMANDKLKTEVWIDEAKIRQLSPEALSYIMNRRPLDVSVGVFTDEEQTTGNWHGEDYTAIARNHRPDHLALLPGEQGACGWADGCGIRTHKRGGDISVEEINTNVLNYSGTENTDWSAPTLSDFDVDGQWSALSQPDKAKVAGHYLIGSASVETFADLHFPVVNSSTGNLNENALRAVIGGRGAALTAVPASIRDAARRRAYRLLNSEYDADLDIPETLSLINQLKKEGITVIQINEDPSYNKVISVIQGKLDNMDTDTRIHYLQEAYDGYFVYEVRHNGESTLLQRDYTVNEDGSIEFEGEPTEVTREIIYKPTTNEEGGITTMCDKSGKCTGVAAKVDCLIQGNSKFEEGDREVLLTMSEAMIDKLVPEVTEPVEPTPQMNKDEAIQVLKDHLSDPDKFMSLLPDETRAQMEHGLNAYKRQREGLISHITANTDVYQEADLTGLHINELTKLANVIKPIADYSAQGVTDNDALATNGEEALLPPGVEAEEGGK